MREKDFTIQEVKSFYDSIGWQMTEDGVYQNARYEDLRPVSREYIHQCHCELIAIFPTMENIYWMPVPDLFSIRNI